MRLRVATYLLCSAMVAASFNSCRHFTHSDRVVVIQPLGDFSSAESKRVFEALKGINGHVILRPNMPLPTAAYYAARGRYRADSLIRYLKRYGSNDTVVIGLTDKDISTSKGNVADWGVMGLGYRPGNACVVSSFRLAKENKSEQFYKVAIHELGHTQGLPHCPDKTCFMRNAEGGNPLNEEKDFCASCKAFLVGKGWKLK